MVLETMEEYALASAEADFENLEEQAPVVFVASGWKNQVSENTPPWMDRKCSYLPSPTGTENTNWDTAAVCMGMDEEYIKKATGRLHTPVEC